MNYELAIALFFLLSGVVLIAVGFVTGRLIEAAHFRSLDAREAELAAVLVSDLKRLPANWRVESRGLVTGTAVIASDRAKVFAARLRNYVGGRVKGYESLLQRARREAMLRMKLEARAAGANAVWNVRLETATIAAGTQSTGIEVIAYGTALRVT